MSQLVNEWSEIDSVLNIANISDSYEKENMARLMENQRTKDLNAELFSEAGTFGTGVNGISTGSGGGSGNVPQGGAGNGVFAPISMALVRRTFPALFANKIVGVQAMSTPVGLAYAIRYMYKDGVNQTEMGFDKVPEYSGFTGSSATELPTSATVPDAGTGVATSVAEAWQVGGDQSYPEITFRIDRQPIEAKSRKLATSFSLEAAMDVQAMQGVDIERELLNMIQYELVAEQDRELLQSVKNTAVKTGDIVTSDGATLSGVSVGGAAAGSIDMSTVDGRWTQEKFTNLITYIVSLANEIALKTRRGSGNFVVVSPRVATALQASGPQFQRNSANINATSVFPEVGVVNDSITVYRDSYARTDYVLVGYKGEGVSDCGVIYSPYVTGLTNHAVAQEDFSPRIGVMSRYAITDTLLGAGRYYRYANVLNLNELLSRQIASITNTQEQP